jgi:putative ABC transport system ATP-binding protein
VSTALVELAAVNRIFPGARPFHALHDIDVRIDAGEYVALVGPSGAGKSTMLNVLGLMDRPTTGEYWMDGSATSGKSENERASLRASSIGFVFQGFHLMTRRTVLDNVMLGTAYGTVPRSERESRARSVLARVGLGRHIDDYPATLSGGERQRVAIARAVVAGPKLLLADEPTGNLDQRRASEIMDMFESLNDDGLTILIITHDPSLAQRARRTISIIDGRLSQT